MSIENSNRLYLETLNWVCGEGATHCVAWHYHFQIRMSAFSSLSGELMSSFPSQMNRRKRVVLQYWPGAQWKQRKDGAVFTLLSLFRRPSWRSLLFVCPSTPKTAPGGQEPLRQPVPVIRLKGFRDWLTVAVYMPVSSWQAGDCGMPSPFKWAEYTQEPKGHFKRQNYICNGRSNATDNMLLYCRSIRQMVRGMF